MRASEHLYDFIKKCEGYSDHAYDDGGGVQTIGWGTIRWDLKTPVKHGDTITVEEAQRQLEIEVHRVEDAINSSIKVDLNQAEFDALCSLFYNIGTGWCTGVGHKQAELVKLINAGKYASVPGQLALFTHDIHGKYVEGLAKRRKWESQMWLSDTDHSHIVAATPVNDPAVTPMPQAVTPAKAEKTITTITKSPSAHWSIFGILAGIGTFVGNAFDFSKDSAQQTLDMLAGKDLSALQTLLGKFSANSVQIGLGLTVTALVVVLARKLAAAGQGRSF